jgi:hypothetical protein
MNLHLNQKIMLFRHFFVFLYAVSSFTYFFSGGLGSILILIYVLVFSEMKFKSQVIVVIFVLLGLALSSAALNFEDNKHLAFLMKQTINMTLFILLLNCNNLNPRSISRSNYWVLLIHICLLFFNIGSTTYGHHTAGLDKMLYGYKGLFVSGNELAVYLLILVSVTPMLDTNNFQKSMYSGLCALVSVLTLTKVGIGVSMIAIFYAFYHIRRNKLALIIVMLLSVIVTYKPLINIISVFIERQKDIFSRFDSITFLFSGRVERLYESETSLNFLNLAFGQFYTHFNNYEMDIVNIMNIYGLFGGLIVLSLLLITLRHINIFMLCAIITLSSLAGHIFFYNGVTLCLFILSKHKLLREK